MKTFQEKLQSYQPYLISIRYLQGIPVVDIVIKDGWTLPEDPNIQKVKRDNETINYYMLVSELPNIGLDDLLGYLDRTIKLNIDKEKKHDLLRSKVNELKELFNKNNLSKLNRLKFVFTEEDLMPNINDLMIEEEIELPIIEPINEIENNTNKIDFTGEKAEDIQLSDEDKEILEEEARAEINRKILENKKQNNSIKNISKKVELPPKLIIPPNERDEESNCLCGPDEACSKCLDSK
jgi:hypothetical protein